MRILALTRYSSLGPSSRVRFYQYISYLTSCGITLQVAPLLGDNYILSLYSGKRPSISSIFKSYIGRILKLMHSRSFDLLWIEKELFPWLPPWTERWISDMGIPYVVDYDDAVFHRYDLHKNTLVRTLLKGKIDAIMRYATTVVVGNNYLAERARQNKARRIDYLPSVVDMNRYSVREKASGQFRIGWIGSPITAPFLGLIGSALKEAIKMTNACLVLVGTGDRDPLPGIEKIVLNWSEDSEIENIRSFNVGIMPLPDEPFERGKCGYKLIQYMACGLPVIASPVGANTQIVEPGKTGFLASSKEDWIQALVTLSKNAGTRNNFGMAGRIKVEREYSLQTCAPRLLEILTRAASR